MIAIAGSTGGLGEIASLSWRQPSPGGGPPIAPVKGRPSARIQIRTTPMRLQIDASAARRESGYNTITGLARNSWKVSDKAARRGVARIVHNGYRLAAIHKGGNVIAQLAAERMLTDLQTHRYGMAFVPRTPPAVTFTPGALSIDVVY